MAKNKRREPVFERNIVGIIKRHPDGFGFLIPEQDRIPDVYIPRQSMTGIMSNDKVEASVRLERGGERLRGDIVKVLARSVSTVSGRLHISGPGRGYLKDESHAWGEDLRVSIPPGLEVKDGDWVSVRVESFSDSVRGFAGSLVGVIGNVEDPLNDDRRVIFNNGIPFEFSKAGLTQASGMSAEVSVQDMAGRIDIQDLPLITIDGQTAKDFDDAIFVESKKEGYRLVVAIADVSHYVKPGAPIDEDAKERGNSTYFPNLVIPMLPEILSNELCSLRPNVPRLAVVADMHLSSTGELVDSSFYEAVIRSHARVTYGQAQEVVDGNPPEEIKHVTQEILRAAELAKVLMARRFQAGSLDLDIPETEIEIDEAGDPVDILKANRLFAHRLIEEMMLMANIAVAQFIKKNNRHGLYRIHEDPDSETISELEGFLESFGFRKRLTGGVLQKQITRALEFFSGKPQEHMINILTLRSMNQAKYSPENVGHFGLGFADYVHFTSPIRRYPDLVIHRIVKSIVYPGKGYKVPSLEELATMGEMLSACEQRSVKAERQFYSIKKARFMRKFLGQEFEGMVSSVAKFGIFVLLRQYDVDGLVRLEDLGNEDFEFDEETLRLVGKKSGRSYCLGDQVKVQVVATNTDLGRIDFVLAEGDGRAATVDPPQKKPAKKRGKTKNNRRGVRKARVRKSSRKS